MLRVFLAQAYYAVEEYLALERATPERYEYVDGLIYVMAGDRQVDLSGCLFWK